MIDQDLERRYADCSELVEVWRMMLEMINRSIKNPDSINPQAEDAFLRTKARIAMLHDSFMDSLKHDKQVGTNMIEIVNRSITLRSMAVITEAENKKLEIEWHEAYLLLNETVSTLNEKRAELANINETVFRMKKLMERIKANFKAFLQSIYFKIMVGLTVAAILVFGVPAMGIYDWDRLRDIRPLEPVVSGTFTIVRFMGMDGPYFRLNDYTEAAFKNPVGGLSHSDFSGDKNQRQASQEISNMLMARVTDFSVREELRNKLESANEYRSFKIIGDGATRPEGYLYVFWFRHVKDARDAANLIQRHKDQLDPNFIVTRKSNVLNVVFSRNKDYAERIQRERVDVMRP